MTFSPRLLFSHSTVTLDTFVEFLSLCESNGFIELKFCLEELREKVGSDRCTTHGNTVCR